VMSCHKCSVVAVGSTWFVEHGKTSRGPYMSNGMALRVAVSEALALRSQKKRSKISVQNSADEISAEYCLCADFKMAKQ